MCANVTIHGLANKKKNSTSVKFLNVVTREKHVDLSDSALNPNKNTSECKISGQVPYRVIGDGRGT